MDLSKASRYAALILSLVLVGIVFYFFSNILAYVVIAWVLSLLGQPVMHFYKKHVRIGKFFQAGNTLCAALTLFSFILLLAFLISMFVPTVVQQARNLAEIDYTKLVEGLEEPINDWNDWFVDLGILEGKTTLQVRDSINQAVITPLNAPTNTASIAIDSLLVAKGETIGSTNLVLHITLPNTNKAIAAELTEIPQEKYSHI